MNVLVLALPRLSIEAHVTRVVPIGNTEPESRSQVTDLAPSTRSVAVGEKATVAPVGEVAFAVLFGALITGPLVSWTTIWNVRVAVFAFVSVAVHVTVVVPIANVDPEAGTQVTGRVPDTASNAKAT